jgi:flagellar protein FliL
MRLILPIVLALVGAIAGGALGWVMREAPAEVASDTPAAAPVSPLPTTPVTPRATPTETLRLPNQFVVPLITEGRVRAMVVIGLALELTPEHGVNLARDEARLRAIFLQLLFDHANLGGFDGVFTAGDTLAGLRRSLIDAARAELGPIVQGVLITELLRQDS